MSDMDGRQRGDENRFRDPRTHLYSLADGDIIVVCPRCGDAAVVRTMHDPTGRRAFCPRRLSCLKCGYTAAWQPPASSCWGGPFDPFFRRPLWLQTPCCGGTLWAFNREHLDLIDGYVRARLRERGSDRAYTSMLEKLPAWIKSAKNRDEVVRSILRLRATLPSDVT